MDAETMFLFGMALGVWGTALFGIVIWMLYIMYIERKHIWKWNIVLVAFVACFGGIFYYFSYKLLS